MEWHSSLIRPSSFAPPSAETSFNFLFNCNLEPFPPSGMDVKQAEMMMMGMERPGSGIGGVYGDAMSTMSDQDKKKRLTCQQLESLEKSFQEEIKLDPERKMRLSRELSLQPRQVAVWFQNRRARWKAKQLERLYDSLRLQFDVVSREKQRLQDEVMKLRAMLMEQGATRKKNTKQVSMGFTEVSGGDETVESTSAIHGGSAGGGSGGALAAQPQQLQQPQQNNMGECHNYTMFGGIEDYNTTSTSVPSPPLGPYWAALPAYPPC